MVFLSGVHLCYDIQTRRQGRTGTTELSWQKKQTITTSLIIQGDLEKKREITHTSSLTAFRDRNKRTISILDPYTPTGRITKSSKALKSTLVTDEYVPGRIVLIKRFRDSCAMTTLSTKLKEGQVTHG
jgi:hypothetical protein